VGTVPVPFRLERVRALRESAEDRAREELAATLALRLRREAILAAAATRVEQADELQRGAAREEALDGASLRALQGWRDRVAVARREAERALGAIDAEVDARRDALVAASRDREALERLKARHEAGQAQLARRAEGAATDEVALAVHRRREARR
jgi:flagellar FliJ protein